MELTIIVAIIAFLVVTLVLVGLLLFAKAKLTSSGEVTIDINGGEKVITTESGSTLLATLANNKVFLPSACGGGGWADHGRELGHPGRDHRPAGTGRHGRSAGRCLDRHGGRHLAPPGRIAAVVARQQLEHPRLVVREIEGAHRAERRATGGARSSDGGTTGGKDQGDTAVDEATLVRIHAAGYPSAIAAGAQTVMASFNSVNGVRMQNSNTSKMIFSSAKIVSYLSHFMTLVPGDIIATAIHDACGARLYEMPAYPDRVLAALKK